MREDIYEKIAQYCKKKQLLEEGDGVVVGLSGGADSVFLLKSLVRLRERWSLKLCAVHVNHGIRGQEADADQRFSEQLAASLGVPCRVFCADIPSLARQQHKTEEEAGRDYRYRCFETCRLELGFKKIAVAHQREDQAETILFRLVRGSSLRGLGGMKPKRGAVIRPLLCIGRGELEQVLAEEQTLYCADSTNQDSRYARNFLRNEVLAPIRERLQPEVCAHIARAGDYLREAQDYIEAEANRAYDRIVRRSGSCLQADIEALRSLHPVLRREIFLRMVQEVGGKRKDITAEHIEQIGSLLEGKSGRERRLPYGVTAQRSYRMLLVYPTEDGKEQTLWEICIELQTEYEIPLLGTERCRVVFERLDGEKIPEGNLKKHYTKCFDCDKIKGTPVFRCPMEGDYLWLNRTGGRKKLSRLLIDEKVAARERKGLWVLAEGNHILWIPALCRCSAYYYVSEETQCVLYAHLSEL